MEEVAVATELKIFGGCSGFADFVNEGIGKRHSRETVLDKGVSETAGAVVRSHSIESESPVMSKNFLLSSRIKDEEGTGIRREPLLVTVAVVTVSLDEKEEEDDVCLEGVSLIIESNSDLTLGISPDLSSGFTTTQFAVLEIDATASGGVCSENCVNIINQKKQS